jgi:class 3 adenylate cyclase
MPVLIYRINEGESMNIDQFKEKPRIQNVLVAFFDINNFIGLTKRIKGKDLFLLIDELYKIASGAIRKAEGHIVKYIGDSALIVFAEEHVNQGVETLVQLKAELESHLESRGFDNTISFSASFGQVTLGFVGEPPFRYFDIYGDTVQFTVRLNGRPVRGAFSLSDSLVDRLGPETRALFKEVESPRIYIDKQSINQIP